MYFSRVKIKKGPDLFTLLRQDDCKDNYISHQILWKLFPNDGSKKRDFLFHKDSKSELPQYLLVSKEIPVESKGVFIETKPYNPVLKKEQQYGFSLIANPVVSKRIEGEKHSTKHDVWMNAKQIAKAKNLDRLETLNMCEDAVKKWLVNKGLSCGFSVIEDDLVIDGYIQNRIYKKKQANPIRFSSIHYQGILTVTDPDEFVNVLYNGLGKSKAFGCGLMLIKKL